MASVRKKKPTKHRKATSNAKLSFNEKKNLFIDSLKASYRKQYDAIQLMPYIKDNLYCVDKVFVEGGIKCFVDSEGTNEKWEPLESYHHIFKDTRTESLRTIIEGDAGHGKSTLTLQLAHDWCTGVKDSPLKDVDVLILLKLRQFANIKSVFTAINLFLLPEESRLSSNDIKDILEKSKNTKILLDGFDEYPYKDRQSRNDIWRIIQLKMFPSFDVIITTRYLPKYKELTLRAERIKLTGFDESSRDAYIRKAITGETNEEAFTKIKQALKDNPILDDLCQVPLFFVTFAHITHERDDFKKFKSVTDFFIYMMKCFHGHTKKKSVDDNVKAHEDKKFESDHTELNKVAFEGLIDENQQITWSKKYLHKRLGQKFYDYYIRVGILVEEDIYEAVDKQHHHGDNLRKSKQVRFYHKIFCEWFAAFMVADIVAAKNNSDDVRHILDKIDPFDLQYVYRFACGMNSQAGTLIIEHLKKRENCDTFAILCIFEQNDDTRESRKAIEDLCSKKINIFVEDNNLLQRSTVQLLQIASSQMITITHLALTWSFDKVDDNGIILHSGIVLPRLLCLEKLTINSLHSKHELTEEDVVRVLNYGLKSERFKVLCFFSIILPEYIRPELITEKSKLMNVLVLHADSANCLNLTTGLWRECEDVSSITELCSFGLSINAAASTSSQTSVIETVKKASSLNIVVQMLDLNGSLRNFDGSSNLILHSGLKLPIVTTLRVMAITTEHGREMTLEEVNGILCYVEKSTFIETVRFHACLMPPSFPLSPRLKNLNVFWLPYGHQRIFLFSIQSRRWHPASRGNNPSEHHLASFRLTTSFDEPEFTRLTDEMYTLEVHRFRTYYRDSPWQQARH